VWFSSRIRCFGVQTRVRGVFDGFGKRSHKMRRLLTNFREIWGKGSFP
jgi:hypothetical protein